MIVDSFIATGALFAAELMKPEKRHAVYFTEKEIRAIGAYFQPVASFSTQTQEEPHLSSGVARLIDKVVYLNHLTAPHKAKL